MDGRIVIITVGFLVLSVFMTVPQPGAGVQGQTDNVVDHASHHHSHSDAARPHITCSEQKSSAFSCQNFAPNSVNNISSQIRMELNASYTYMAMAAYFARDDVAYRGFAKFFMKASDEERDHAVMFINYLASRGGYVSLKTIHAPAKIEWETGPLEAVRDALELERAVNDALLSLHWEAQEKNDPHLQDFIESEFLTEQVDSIKQLSEWRTILTRLQNDPLGMHQFDEELTSGSRV